MSQNPNAPDSPDAGSTRLLIVALCVAVLAVILVNVYIGIVRSQSAAETFTVYRLTRSMERGEELEEEDLKATEVPQRFEAAFEDAVEKSDISDTAVSVGEVLRKPARMEQVLTYGLFQKDQTNDLPELIDSGMRLVALPVNSDELPAISPGSRVDIEAPFPAEGGGEQMMTVMENVHVLAVGERSIIDEQREGDHDTARNFDTISIQVNPGQATALSMIDKARVGDFELHVRNPGDSSTPKIPGGGINPGLLDKVGLSPEIVEMLSGGSG